MVESGLLGIDYNSFLHFLDLWVLFFAKIHSLVSFFGISGFMGMIFRKFSEISLDLWILVSRFEWHNLVSCQLSDRPPPPWGEKTI